MTATSQQERVVEQAVVDRGSALVGRPLHAVRVLTGGQHARTVLADDGEQHVVVRTFPRGDDAVLREAAVLARLEPLGVLAPRLLAHGTVDGLPTVVTSALPGSVPPADLDLGSAADQLGAALARVHELDPTGLPDDGRAPKRVAGRLAGAARAVWPTTDQARVLTHGDFWSGNAVWQDDRLSGIVDWSGAMSAPRGVDVAWCRQDLVLLGSTDAADRFLAAYERAGGVRVLDVHAWDVLAAARADPYVETWAPNYAGIGREDITARVIRQRFDAWVRRLLD
ncbi:aminoglycoside phosphotransferase family protein [Curtobacterium sp. 458]|uniref:phosphotransferase family protein n=1 Tax=Curtobacterium sp. 458 TaxID=3050069 RepID=UPI0025B3B0F8|nr:aminoglycoside phosphotransferase family protein [Curtobacterium sp. 458]WJY00962.1 aminoglycoside phosphotransferase family protein [Curtobacterium sp. 458]